MDIKLIRETVPAAECIYEGIQEQGLELDYILPDYYPEIFRLVRSEAVPSVTEWSVSGDKLVYELRCDIRILYSGGEGTELQCVTQRQSFRKTVELGRQSSGATVRLTPKCDHINVRAVNSRRIDLRGAVSVKISVTGEHGQEVISDASGMNIQLRRTPVRFASKSVNAEKTLRLTEETELSAAQPTASAVVSVRCSTPECERKLISGKLLAKGEAEVELLYTTADGGGAVEPMSFSVPYSQIIDIDGIDDSFDCTVTPEVIGCEVVPAEDKSGENRVMRTELELRLVCRAVRTVSAMIGTDAYSTVYPCEVNFSEICAEQLPVVYTESFRRTMKLAEGDSVPQTVYAMWVTPKNINTRIGDDGRSVTVSGMLSCSMAARDASGMLTMPDKDEAFEENIPLGDDITGCTVTAEVISSEVSYNITGEGVLAAKVDISVKISALSCTSVRAVTDITVDDSVKKQRDGDYAVKLYFGVENEEVWDIAKRYSTSVSAVIEENELPGERLGTGGMLLIPIVT